MEALDLFLIFCSIIISAFFSASETAITGCSQAKIHKLKSDGNKRAEIVSDIRAHKEGLIGTVLIGNNAVNIFASSLAAGVFIKLFGEAGLIYATCIMTVLIIVFAEVLPKTYAFKNAEEVSLLIAPALRFCIKIMEPVTIVTRNIVDFIMDKTGLNEKPKNTSLSSTEELRGAIDYHLHIGEVKKTDRDMLGNILDLRETVVGEIMIHRKSMVSVNIEQTNIEIVNDIFSSGHTRVPLWEDNPDNIVGVINIKDLIKAININDFNYDSLDIKKIASQPWFVPETRLLSEQLAEFRNKKSYFSIVVDEYGTVIGVVTLTDVVEEIIGRIEDEHGRRPEIVRSDVGYIVDGTVTVRDINRALDINLHDDEANTIAGFIIYEAEKIPEVGEVFNFCDINFKILSKENNQITKILIRNKD